jgi:hypothetical protein
MWMMYAIYIAALIGDVILWMPELKLDRGWIVTTVVVGI